MKVFILAVKSMEFRFSRPHKDRTSFGLFSDTFLGPYGDSLGYISIHLFRAEFLFTWLNELAPVTDLNDFDF